MLLLLFFIFAITDAAEKYEAPTCSTQKALDESHIPGYIIENDKLIFFQSPNFPKALYNSSDIVYRCKAKFLTEKQDGIWFAMLYGNADIFVSNVLNSECYSSTCLNLYQSNYDTFTYTSTNGYLEFEAGEEQSSRTWKAFQAALVSYDSSNNYLTCPLSGQTFKLDNTTDITIPISSSFYNLDNISKNCSWNFSIKPTQLLKVVVKNFTVIDNNDNFHLSLIADGMVVKNLTDESNNNVFYFNGTNFNFIFSNENNTVYFFITVSAVQKVVNYTSDGCKVIKGESNSKNTKFTNIDTTNGYLPYQHCEGTISIPENHEATLHFYTSDIESCCDTFSLKYGNNQTLSLNNESSNLFYLTREFNGALLNFYSDGNNQGAGYLVNLDTFECVCNKYQPVLNKCIDDSDNIQPLETTDDYCSNMACTYEIVQNSYCPNSYISIQLTTALQSSDDELNLYVNGNVVKIPPQNLSFMYFPYGTNLTLKFSSGPPSSTLTTNKKYFWGGVDSLKTPNFKRIDLNQTNSEHFIWLQDLEDGDAVTVCTLTGILEVFVSDVCSTMLCDDEHFFSLQTYQIFDSSNMTSSFIGTLDAGSSALTSLSENRPRSRKSLSGCFTLYARQKRYNNKHSVLFKVFEETDCKNNVFQISPKISMTNIHFDSQLEACKVVFLAGIHGNDEVLPLLWIKSLITDSNLNFTFLSAFNDNVLFEFNTDKNQWQDIQIYAPALSVMVPKMSKVNFTFLQVFSEQTHNSYANFPSIGIMASPSYSGYLNSFSDTKLYSFYFADVVVVELTFLQLYGNNFPILETGGINQTLTQHISFITNKFSIYYAENLPKNNRFLIQYTFQKYIPFVTISTKVYTESITSSSVTGFQTSTAGNALSSETPSLFTTPSTFLSTSFFSSPSTVSSINEIITSTKYETSTKNGTPFSSNVSVLLIFFVSAFTFF